MWLYLEMGLLRVWFNSKWASQVVLVVKNLPANAGDMRRGSIPGSGRSPRGGTATSVYTTAVFLPGEFPWTEKPGRLQCIDSNRVGHNWSNLPHTHVSQNEAIWVLSLGKEKDARILVPPIKWVLYFQYVTYANFLPKVKMLLVILISGMVVTQARASLVAHLVKNSPGMRDTWLQSLSWEDPLEMGTATHSSILAWRIPWTVLSMEVQRAGHDWATFTFRLDEIYKFYASSP